MSCNFLIDIILQDKIILKYILEYAFIDNIIYIHIISILSRDIFGMYNFMQR